VIRTTKELAEWLDFDYLKGSAKIRRTCRPSLQNETFQELLWNQ